MAENEARNDDTSPVSGARSVTYALLSCFHELKRIADALESRAA